MPRLALEGSPIAYALAGLLVASAFAISVSASTEPDVPRDERARLAYAECLTRSASPSPCAAEREAALTLCFARRAPAECEASLAGADRDPEGALAAAARPPLRLVAPLHASLLRAIALASAAFFPLAWVLATRGHRRQRVVRVALGAAVGALLAGVPPLLALAAAQVLSALLPGSDVVLLGFGFFVATFVAVLTMPALAGVSDGRAGGDAVGTRVHWSLALAAAGMAAWTLLVGPIPSLSTVWLQSAAAHAFAVTGYLSMRPRS